MNQPRERVATGVAAAYAVAAIVSLLAEDGAFDISAVWLPSGVGLIAVLIWGYWLLPLLAVVNMAADATVGGLPLLAAAGVGSITAAEIAVAAWLLRRGGAVLKFDLPGTARFAIVCLILVPIGGAMIGTGLLRLTGEVPAEAFFAVARNWWFGVMLGILCVVPLANSWLVHGVPRFEGRRREALTIFAALLALAAFILMHKLAQGEPVEGVLYASLPMVLWASVFLRETGAAAALSLTVLLAVTANHLVPTSPMPIWEIGTYVVTFGLMSLMIADAQTNLAYMVRERTRQAQLAELAYRDALTGLANRTRYQERLVEALEAARAVERRVAVLFIDLDGFKWINDTLGHAVGDELIRRVGERFRDAAGSGNMVARIGGDEFAVLLDGPADAGDVRRAADDLLAHCAAPIRIGGNRVHIEASIGVAIHPDHAADAEQLLRLADLAMYEAKKFSGPSVVVFSKDLERDARTRHELQQDLREAVERGEFRLEYQPVVDLGTREIVYVEALLRWEHPRRGMVPPELFVPLLEQNGLIGPIGRWVFQEACAQLAQWRRMRPNLRLAVNVSAAQFQEDSVVETVRDALASVALPADALMVEVTEGVFVGQAPRALQGLRALADCGVRLAMDDFGTGYSALASFQQYPLDMIKIDRSFVADVLTDPTSHALVSTMLDLAHRLGLDPVAEGVESEAQAAQLYASGCRFAQGFLFGEAEPAEPFTRRLERRREDREGTADAAPGMAGSEPSAAGNGWA